MSYKSLMVHLDPALAAFQRLSVAVDLAKRFDLRLIGVTAANLPANALSQAAERQREDYEAGIAALRANFEGAAKGADTRWRAAFAAPEVFVAEAARAADLLVVGRSADAADRAFAMKLEPLIMTAGRPLLIVPPNTACLSADRIIVAWKQGRHTRLAIQLALPLMQVAKAVTVLGVGDDCAPEELDDVADYLRLHGVATQALWRPASGAAEVDVVFETAVLGDADLIVSGAKCRGRLQEAVFGGMTEALINTSPICCLTAQ